MPLLVLMCLGATDLAQAYRLDVNAAGAARAGMKGGVKSSGAGVGLYIRDEPNSTDVPEATAWGNMGGGQSNSCDTRVSPCGDTYGCTLPPDSHSAFTLQPGLKACFAVRTCTLTSAYTCSSYGGWNSWPTSAGQGLQIRVVILYQPATPLIAQLAGNGGNFYLQQSVTGLQCNC